MVRQIFDCASTLLDQSRHLTRIKGYRLKEEEILLSNMVSLIFLPRYLISCQVQAHSAPSRLQCRQAVVSPMIVSRTCFYIYFRCNRELFAFYSSLCAYYAWVCFASFKSRTCTRPLHPFDITTPGDRVSSPARNCISWLSCACCSGSFSNASPNPTTQKDAIRHGFEFFWGS